MPTLILGPRYDEDSQLLWRAAQKRGWQIERVGYGAAFEARRAQMSAPLAIYGGYMWGEHVARELGVDLLAPANDWLLGLGEKWTRRRIWASTVGEVRTGGFPVFVKSLEGKQLASRVYASADDVPDVGDDVRVLAQEPVIWAFEYRCFVSWRGVVTSSQYAVNGELDTGVRSSIDGLILPSYASVYAIPEFMSRFLGQCFAPMRAQTPWMPMPMPCVIDVGCIEGRGMAVVEANPAWCSGLYACDPDKALDVVAEACVEPCEEFNVEGSDGQA